MKGLTFASKSARGDFNYSPGTTHGEKRIRDFTSRIRVGETKDATFRIGSEKIVDCKNGVDREGLVIRFSSASYPK